MNHLIFKYYENIRYECYECFRIQMSLQLISISLCVTKNLTISKLPLLAAKTKGVMLNVRVKFQESLNISIE